jgi:adenylate kinase family enzyme
MEDSEVTNPRGIVLLGANGSGKSTLGRELARLLNFAHLDVEDYYFYKTDVPYTSERLHNERNELMLSDMKKHGSFVVSGVFPAWAMNFCLCLTLRCF